MKIYCIKNVQLYLIHWVILLWFAGCGVFADEAGDFDPENELLNDRINRQLVLIEENELRHGPVNLSLAPPLRQLAAMYQSLNRHDDAFNALMRALFIQRRHAGLYDVEQTSILMALIPIHHVKEEWRKIDDVYDHIHFIYGRNYEESDPEWLPVLSSEYEWNMEAQELTTGIHPDEYYVAAKKLKRRIEKIKKIRQSNRLEENVNVIEPEPLWETAE